MKHVLSVLVGTVIVPQGGNCSHSGTLAVGSLVESDHVSHIYPSKEKPFCPVWWEVASEDDDRVKVLVSLEVTLDGPWEIVSIVVS